MSDTDENIEQKFHDLFDAYRTVRSWSKVYIFDDLWFKYFIQVIESGWTKQFTFLGDTYKFDSLYDFIKDRDGLDADPLMLYLCVETASNCQKFIYADHLLKLFDANGLRERLELTDKTNKNKSKVKISFYPDDSGEIIASQLRQICDYKQLIDIAENIKERIRQKT